MLHTESQAGSTNFPEFSIKSLQTGNPAIDMSIGLCLTFIFGSLMIYAVVTILKLIWRWILRILSIIPIIIGSLLGHIYYRADAVTLALGVIASGYLAWIEKYKQAVMVFGVMTGIAIVLFLILRIKAWFDRGGSFFRSSRSDTAPEAWRAPSYANTDEKPAESFGNQFIRKPSHSFNEVDGMAELKAKLMDAVNDNRTAGKNGILLTGDPGNGKTFIAEALAGELKCNFMPVTIGDIQSKWIGQTTEQLQEVFKAASSSGPLVLFFDECDSMLRDRGTMMGSSNDESLKTANAFLTGIVDIRKVKGVIVIAASNYNDQLDGAATRDARFDFKIHIPCPDTKARHGLLVKFTGTKDVKLAFEDGVLERLVRRWEGFSVARIRSVAEKITKNAKAQGRRSVSMQEAMAALREVQGSMGGAVPEDTPTLRDGNLYFDPEQREKLLTLAMRMENIDEVERMGGQIPKGVLFFGPPGTGKTSVAKSLAKTSGWAFLATSGNDLLSDSESFAKLLKKARDLRPCIVFMDEADVVLLDRAVNRFASVTTTVLKEMDGVGQLHDVMFIAATNMDPDSMDAAIIRGGRFGEHFEFKLPEDDTVLKMVEEWIHGKKDTAPFHEEFTPETVAKILSGLAQSDIKDKLQQAVNTGVGRIMRSEGIDRITVDDLMAVMR